MTAPAAAAVPRLALRSAARTHPGAVRRINEDCFLDRPGAGLWAVADGMGGHQGGAEASRLVVDALTDIGPYPSGYAFLGGVVQALEAANAGLRRRAAALPPGDVTGATVVALLAQDGHAACVWAGDSRAYRLSTGGMRLLTRDHTLVQELVDADALAPDAAAADPRGHIVTRAVGAADALALDRQYVEIQPGDRFLLCSDGLTGCLGDGCIGEMLSAERIEDAADRLLLAALERGAPDNVTVVVIEAAAV